MDQDVQIKITDRDGKLHEIASRYVILIRAICLTMIIIIGLITKVKIKSHPLIKLGYFLFYPHITLVRVAIRYTKGRLISLFVILMKAVM